MSNMIELSGRMLLSALFLTSAIGKIGGYAATEAYMASQGVPGILLPAVIALEIVAPLLLIVGWHTRLVAFGLAIFTLLAAFIFHFNFGDQIQMILFMKNVAITGALLMLTAHGPGKWSIDYGRESVNS